MTASTAFEQLCRTLAGTFQNRDQALADPAWYVHLRLWCSPTRLFVEDSVTFLIEQASAAFDQAPYRQRVLRIRNETDQLTAEYYALKNPLAWQGATQAPERLQALQPDDLQTLVNSRLSIQSRAEGNTIRFEARQQPGQYCQFVVNGETKLVELAFDAIATSPDNSIAAAFWMYDKGIDAATHKPTWGALHGPFKLIKTHDDSAQLPDPVSSQSA
ncbi:chromophore lyase CpcT/CpeT [Leptolyngbya iicbica]|uniref:Chromophore lyase CpcT/CpeT n=2 Tax=Cyanophyceae TaxID=3028117 RepID=A0A4Q7E7X8_9CYAN|nr:chromophore lyase CpcT/CpeT [Leptolyngbya sp. LK]RZM78628.1 chorismate mutase [Leptolyngbya sp. LK]